MTVSSSVTVAMPIYNGQDYLDEALSAICAQTFDNFSILISDNASTDRTAEIIRSWEAKDRRIRVFTQLKNIGARANYLWLMENANTDWIMFAAYDDLWSPNYIGDLHDVAMRFPKAEIVGCNHQVFKETMSDGNYRPFPCQINEEGGFLRCLHGLKYVTAGWYYGLLRREAFRQSWREFESFGNAWGHDFLVMLPFVFSGTIVGTNKATFYHRDTGVSAARYVPQTLSGQAHLYFTYLRECLRALARAPLPWWQKVLLIPRMFLYADRHGWKFRRLLRRTIMYPYTWLKAKRAAPPV